MRHVLSQFRRSVVILALIYGEGIGFLAWGLPFRPTVVVPRRDFHQMLIGFSPDGKRLAVGPRVSHISVAGPDDCLPLPDDPFQIWDVSGGAPPARLGLAADIDHQVMVAFARSPTGRRFFWPYVDDPEWRRRVLSPNPWGIDVRDPKWRAQLPTINTEACEFSPDGRSAVRGDGSTYKNVVEWQTERVILRLPESTVSFAFLPDGRSAVSAQRTFIGEDLHAHYRVCHWNLSDGVASNDVDWDDRANTLNGGLIAGTLQFTPEGRWLVNIRGALDSRGSSNTLVVWDADTGQNRLSVPTGLWLKSARNGQTLVTIHAAADPPASRLRMFEIESGASYSLYPNSSDAVIGDVPVVAVNQDGHVMAVGVPDPTPHPLAGWPRLVGWLERIGIDLHRDQSFVAIIDPACGRELARLPFGPAIGEYTPELRFPFGPPIWFEPPALNDIEPTMTFSSDGRRLAVLGGDAIRIWDLPIRKSWGLILSLAAIPPAALAFLILAVRGLRRVCTPRPAPHGAV